MAFVKIKEHLLHGVRVTWRDKKKRGWKAQVDCFVVKLMEYLPVFLIPQQALKGAEKVNLLTGDIHEEEHPFLITISGNQVDAAKFTISERGIEDNGSFLNLINHFGDNFNQYPGIIDVQRL